MRFKRSIIVLLLTLMLFTTRASAQQEPSLASIEIDLWPEYDQPSVLVIYRITLPASVALPAELVLRIPAGAQINAVAVRQVDGLVNTTYNQQASDGWNVLTIQATTPEIHLEYYDPSLVKDGSSRHYEYRWPGDYAVDSMVLQVQQPFGASEMRISPSLGSGQQAQDGLTYFSANQGALVDNQTFTIVVDYQKSTDDLSSTNIQVQPSSPISSDEPGSIGLTNALPWILVGFGLLLIVGGGLWYWQSGRDKPETGRKRSRRRGGEPADVVVPTGGKAVYCHQCGNRAEPGDRFCRKCGAPLRQG